MNHQLYSRIFQWFITVCVLLIIAFAVATAMETNRTRPIGEIALIPAFMSCFVGSMWLRDSADALTTWRRRGAVFAELLGIALAATALVEFCVRSACRVV